MPELPDLEIIREVLAPRLDGQAITAVEVVRPTVVRDLTGQGVVRPELPAQARGSQG